MAQLGWHVNIDNCVGCRGCEGACKQEYSLPTGVRRRRVLTEIGETAGVPWRRHISLACNHCERPACLHACPVGRYWKDEATQPDIAELRAHFGVDAAAPYTGLVGIRPTVAENAAIGVDCAGCKRCMAACPYGAPQWDETNGVMDKCTGCLHRIHPAADTTLPAARQKPACVVSCSSYALSFGDMADVNTWAQRRAGDPVTVLTEAPAGALEFANPALTNPSIRFTRPR